MAETKDEFKYDPEDEKKRVLRLPFALCKQAGITIQDWWTPRDAWDALKYRGMVADPSEEMKDYFRELKKKASKESYENRKARNKAKKQQKKDPEHNPDPNYKHVKGAVAGVKRGKPMTFKEADSGHCNPFYKQAWNDYTQTGYIGYRTNCQTCVAAFIARRQGYDVRALPNLDNESIYRLSLDPMLAYVDKNGNHPTERAQKKGQGAKSFLESQLSDGRIYSLTWQTRGTREGHIVTVGKKNGKIWLYDPQNDHYCKDRDALRYMSRGIKMRVADLTDMRIDEQFCDKIFKRSVKK